MEDSKNWDAFYLKLLNLLGPFGLSPPVHSTGFMLKSVMKSATSVAFLSSMLLVNE